MNISKNFPTARSERGSALVTVLLFSFLLLSLVASIVQWSVNESRLNVRNRALFQARNAAEAVSEYGCYQVVRAFATRMNPTFEATGYTPVAFPTTLGSTFFPSNLSNITLQAGAVQQVPSASMYYIDPRDPNNTFDPLVGRYVLRRDVTVLSKVTVQPPGGIGPVTAYVQQKVSVRGAPLFAYAIFYSGNDLEVNPLPTMDIWGPVHVNGHLFIGVVGTAATTFHGIVTASGHIFHAWRGTTSVAQEGSTMSSTVAVNFATEPTGVSVASMRTSGGVWNDSTMGADSSTNGIASLIPLVTAARTAAFVTYASATWKGNVQTSAMGITAYNPMGFSEVVAHNGTTNTDILATDDVADDAATVGTTVLGTGYGHGYGPHSLIEPSLMNSVAAPGSSDPYRNAKLSIEEQKFANKAALYFKVVVTAGSPDTAVLTMYGDPNSAPAGTPAANIGPNGGLKLGTVPSNVIQFVPYFPFSTVATTYSASGTNVAKGMYDSHEAHGVNLVQFNMAALKTALVDMIGSGTTANTDILMADNTTKWGAGTLNGYEKYTVGSSGWNGGIYVEIQSNSTNFTGVLMANGDIPSGSSMVPGAANGTGAVNGVFGLTVASHAPVYILGSYNADGTISTVAASTSAMYPDDGHTGAPGDPSAESPCALVGDAITLLSPNYFGTDTATGPTQDLAPNGSTATGAIATNPSTSNAYKSKSTLKPNNTGGVEIAAAFISGSNTTSPNSTGTQLYSGGVHNMPRFLETWTGTDTAHTAAIRGSLVNMYNNRTSVGIWSANYYMPPVRLWGFNKLFANGNYPPICPQVISYRRVDFTFLSPGEYATALNSL